MVEVAWLPLWWIVCDVCSGLWIYTLAIGVVATEGCWIEFTGESSALSLLAPEPEFGNLSQSQQHAGRANKNYLLLFKLQVEASNLLGLSRWQRDCRYDSSTVKNINY